MIDVEPEQNSTNVGGRAGVAHSSSPDGPKFHDESAPTVEQILKGAYSTLLARLRFREVVTAVQNRTREVRCRRRHEPFMCLDILGRTCLASYPLLATGTATANPLQLDFSRTSYKPPAQPVHIRTSCFSCLSFRFVSSPSNHSTRDSPTHNTGCTAGNFLLLLNSSILSTASLRLTVSPLC